MEMNYVALGAGLAVGLSGLGVAIGQSALARMSVEILGKNPNLHATLMMYTIL
ncbi:MAG: hypothetical protein H6767_07680 [Candidatus Peribacteria bacterium]|nr:MAG: hypothetical protein H6767_07680 [Candidatus Peribacteria bacterium]